MRYPRYPVYKDSGVEWLGEIPSQWDTTLLKYAYKIQLGKMLTSEPNSPDDTLEPYLRSANVYWNGVDVSDVKEMWFSPYEKSQYRLKPGDLVVCEGGDVGRSAIWQKELAECYIQNAVHRVRAKDGHSNRFLYYWLSTLKNAEYIDLICSKATIAHLTAEKLSELPLAVPPQAEQRAIAAFLDRETAMIDALIRKQERLIDLLEEKRAALISHTVTKGLDPDVEMKDSGIEWLGEIPVRWNAMPLKYACNQSAIYGANVSASEYTDEGVRFIRTTDISDRGELLSDDAVYLDRGIVEDYLLEDGDLLLSRSGTVGRSFICDGQASEECAYAGYLVGFKIKESVLLPKIAFYFTKSKQFEEWISLSVISSTIGNVNGQKYANMPLPVPPLSEQRAIAAYLDRETARIDALIGKAEAMIECLQEYRTALISAAVTGKIDVRDVI